jgi:DNA-binding response OmpR family regulator
MPARRVKAKTRAKTRGRRAGKRARILVIEDDLPTRQALQVLLEDDSHEVRAAKDGNEGLALVRSFDPHVVLMDWRVPGLAGARLCQRIARLPHPPRIIIVSSADEAFEIETDVAARFRKPVDLRRLNAVIGSQLGGREEP